jgi:hypothetical protein
MESGRKGRGRYAGEPEWKGRGEEQSGGWRERDG